MLPIFMRLRLKNVSTIYFNEAYWKVLQWFFSYPSNEIGLNDLSAALSVAKTTAKRVVLQLEKETFLRKEVLGKIWRISCNQNHNYNSSKKIAYNLMMIYNSTIIENVHELVQSEFGQTPRAIILFGSYRKGDDNEKSDIDIAVEVLDTKNLKIYKLGEFQKFGYRKNVTVNVHTFSRTKIDINLFANIVNGIVLEGFLEVRP